MDAEKEKLSRDERIGKGDKIVVRATDAQYGVFEAIVIRVGSPNKYWVVRSCATNRICYFNNFFLVTKE